MNISITEDQARQILNRQVDQDPYHTAQNVTDNGQKRTMKDYRVPIFSCYLAETTIEGNQSTFELLLSLVGSYQKQPDSQNRKETNIDRINGAFEGPHWTERQAFDLHFTVEWLMLAQDERDQWGSLRNYKSSHLSEKDRVAAQGEISSNTID